MGEVYVTVPPAVVPGAARILTPGSDWNRIPDSGRSQRMEGIRDLLETARTHGLIAGRFRGLLHIAIGRTVTKPDGIKLSSGLTWREVAALLKNLRFDPELGREVGADPDTLSPRDRERYWYAVIAMARVDSSEAMMEAETLIAPLKEHGFVVASTHGSHHPTSSGKGKPAGRDKAAAKPEEKPKKKK